MKFELWGVERIQYAHIVRERPDIVKKPVIKIK